MRTICVHANAFAVPGFPEARRVLLAARGLEATARTVLALVVLEGAGWAEFWTKSVLTILSTGVLCPFGRFVIGAGLLAHMS